MKTLIIVVLVLLASSAMAQQNCTPPTPPTPTTVCNCNCDCGTFELPGLWEVSIQGHKVCGVITVVGSGFMLNEEFFAINKLKLAKKVEFCE